MTSSKVPERTVVITLLIVHFNIIIHLSAEAVFPVGTNKTKPARKRLDLEKQLVNTDGLKWFKWFKLSLTVQWLYGFSLFRNLLETEKPSPPDP